MQSSENAYTERILTLLGDEDPIKVLENTPRVLETLLESLGEYRMSQSYAPGKWTAREILCHLADVELGKSFRIRQVLAGAPIQVFDENRWAERYGRLEPSLAVETFRALRAWNLALFAGFDLHDWLTEAQHPERGPVSLDLEVRYMAGHDLNHLAQLQMIAEG